MRSPARSIQGSRPIAIGGGWFAAFLARSAGLGSLIIALLVALADLDDEAEDRSGVEQEPDDGPTRPSSSRRPSRRG